MIKVELHAHTSDDPGDRIPHDTHALLDHAARFGYGALAITLHNRWFDPAPFDEYAAARGIVLLSGIERTIDGKHVLLINVPREAGDLQSFDDVRALKQQTPAALVVAPHPFYPIPSALGVSLDELIDVVDALEVNAMYTQRAGLQPPGPRLGCRPRQDAGRQHRSAPARSDGHDLERSGRDAGRRRHLRGHPRRARRRAVASAQLAARGVDDGADGARRARTGPLTVEPVHGFTGSRVHRVKVTELVNQ